MFWDYTAFYSYTKCKGRYVTLGDNTKLAIAGTGNAIFSLNGKTILLRN